MLKTIWISDSLAESLSIFDMTPESANSRVKNVC